MCWHLLQGQQPRCHHVDTLPDGVLLFAASMMDGWLGCTFYDEAIDSRNRVK
jgi:hypothetical protein